jgi:hypothetical protein
MTWRRRGACLAGVISACSYPFDATWVTGVCDGGDDDVTALAISSREALVGPLPLPASPPSTSASLHGALAPCGTPSDQLRAALEARAPPSA